MARQRADTVTKRTDEGRRFRLRPFARNAVLTTHIVVAVGLLGDAAGYLAVAIRGVTATEPAVAQVSYETLRMFSYVFGIPLSFAALLTGVILGLGTPWGVFRYRWVTAKLVLILSVIAVGALVLDGAMEALLSGEVGSEGRLIGGAIYDVAALTTAVVLAVFKPGKRWSSR